MQQLSMQLRESLALRDPPQVEPMSIRNRGIRERFAPPEA
jgi:hypothetical protein